MDSMNASLELMEFAFKGNETDHYLYAHYENWIRTGEFPALTSIDREQLNRFYQAMYLMLGRPAKGKTLVDLLGRSDIDPWIKVRIQLASNALEQARDLIESAELEPRLKVHHRLAREVYERLGMPEKASFYNR